MNAEGFKLARLKMKKSQKEFSEMLGISESTVAAIESGRRPISDRVRAILAEHIQIDEEFIYFLESYSKITNNYPF